MSTQVTWFQLDPKGGKITKDINRYLLTKESDPTNEKVPSMDEKEHVKRLCHETDRKVRRT